MGSTGRAQKRCVSLQFCILLPRCQGKWGSQSWRKIFSHQSAIGMFTWVPPTWLCPLSPEGKAEYDVLETTANNAFNTCAQPAMLLPLCISMHLFLAFSCCCWDAICCFPTPAVKPVQLELGITCLPSGAVAAAAKIWIYRYKVL